MESPKMLKNFLLKVLSTVASLHPVTLQNAYEFLYPCLPIKTIFACFEICLGPLAINTGCYAFSPANFSNRLLASETFQNNANFMHGRELPASCLPDLSYNILRRCHFWLLSGLLCPIM